jgi:hypothetical protein
MVVEDFSGVKFFMPFDGFNTSPLPASREAYVDYKQHVIEFIKARNRRILKSCR